MAVTLTGSTAGIMPEYASTNLALTRTVAKDATGFYVPTFAAQITYSRVDYVVDVNGNKTGIIQHEPATPTYSPMTPYAADPYHGSLTLTQEDLIAAGFMGVATDSSIFGWISNTEDALIRADLVKRGIEV